jgi:hypothetical protein
MVSTRTKNRRMVAEALVDSSWLSDVEGDLTIEGCLQCVRLWEEIDRVPHNAMEPDSFSWKGSADGRYSAKDTYMMLCQGGTEFAMYKPIWKSFTPLKCKYFSWLALKYRLWTSDRRPAAAWVGEAL